MKNNNAWLEYRKSYKHSNKDIQRTHYFANNPIIMQNIDTRLTKFISEREEIHKKMIPLKDKLKPLSIRLKQVSKNIETLKTIKKKSDYPCNK